MAGQSINITINVTDGNSAQAVEQIVGQLQALGPAGMQGGAEAAAGLDQVGEHALTSLDNVRLLRDDLGIRIPRSMEKAIANSQMLSGAIGSIGTVLLGIGAVDIFARMAESAYNAYEKFIDINAAQREFLANVQKSKDADFVNVHSIETATLRINEATEATTRLQKSAEEASGKGWHDLFANVGTLQWDPFGSSQIFEAKDMSNKSGQAAADAQQLSPEQQSLQHQLNLANIESDHAGDTALKGQQKITAELQKQLDIHRENQRFTAIEDRERGNPGKSDSGSALQAAQDKAAKAQARAEEINEQRSQTDQIIQMQNEATNASLQGNALAAAKEQQEIDAVTRKYMEGEISKRTAAEETAAIKSRYDAQELLRQQQLDEQTKHMADEAAQAGLKGNQLIAAQLKTQLDSIDAAERKAVGTGTETPGQSNDFNSQRSSARQMANQKMIESDEQFQERIRELNDRSDSYMLQGYARIEAETQKHLAALSKDYEEQYGKDQSDWAGYQQAATQIEAAAEREREQLHQRTMEQLTKEEEQAARLILPDWQQSSLAIQDQYKDRLRQIEMDVKQHVMTEQEGAAAVTAAWQVEQAQLQKNAEETRDRMASTLSSLFSNPAQFFEKRAMDTAFQMMANELMSVMKTSGAGGGILQYLLGMGPQMSTSTNPLTDMKSVLGLGGSAAGTASTATAGAALSSAGTTLFTAGTGLNSAAFALQSAATALQFSGAAGGGSIPGLSFGGGSTFGMDSSGAVAGVSSSSASSMSSGWSSSTDGLLPGVADGTSGLQDQANGLGSIGGKTGQYLGAATGAVMGGIGIYNAYQNSDPVSGLLSGAMGGAEVGSLFGPIGMGIGAAVGGLAGLFAGLFGDQGKGKAQDYDKNTVQPGISKEMQDFEAGRAGYNAVSKSLNDLEVSAKSQTSQWGSGARSWYDNHIKSEIETAIASVAKQERGGRSAITLSAAQYHEGGWIGDFGDMRTSGNEGYIHALKDEFMVKPGPARAHAPLLQAINSGASIGYSRSVQPRMPASSGSGSTVNLTIQALDSKSVEQWARGGGGRTLVSVINQAQRQYSGVGRG